jgi:S-layer homology domain
MNNRNKALFATLALSAAFGVGMALQAKFTDIPAKHWAEGAVNRMVAEGIVNGYPDGTFRGNNTVNRYEVTSMFDRLIASKRFSGIESNASKAAQVESDISALRAAASSNAASVAALQAEITALKASAGSTTGAINPELAARITQLEEKVAALSTTDNVSFNERIAALEESVKTLQDAPAPAAADDAGLKALEDRLKTLETDNVRAAELQGQVESQGARIVALENRVSSLNTSVADLQKALSERPTPPTPPSGTAPTEPSATTPSETPAAPASTTPFLVLSGGISTNLVGGPAVPVAPLGLGLFGAAQLNFSDSFGIRLSADLSEIPSAGANLMLQLGGGLYAGVGAGLVFENGGFYAGGVLGFSFDIAQNFGLFLEANPRFNFSSSSFGVKTALGLRLGL